jgi:pSer/pThr/pTyr-binding forkhead associated (FHA) protein
MPNSWIVGARSECDLVVDVASVSGRHCRLSRDEAGFFLEDLKSTNGTFLNGLRLPPNERAPLKRDDAVHLGSHALDVRGLLAKLDSGPEGSLEFHGRDLVLGRSPTCDRSIDQPMVSSRHARLFRSAEQILIEDLSSANGTFVNGRRIESATAVSPGDTIGLGSYTLTLATTTQENPLETPRPDTSQDPDAGRKSLHHPDAGAWSVVALLAQAPVAAMLMILLAGSSVPATLFGLVIAAVWFGLSTGVQAHLVDAPLARLGGAGSGSAGLTGRLLALVASCLAQCFVAWVIVASATGLRAASLPGLGFLALAGLAGLALGLVAISVVPRPGHAWGCVVALAAVFCLLGGLRPSLQGLPAAVRPLSGITPSRWAFEGLLLLEAGEPAAVRPGNGNPPDGRRDLGENYFPLASARMGLAADALALVLMLIGLAALLGYLWTSHSVAESAASLGVNPAAGAT